MDNFNNLTENSNDIKINENIPENNFNNELKLLYDKIDKTV